MRTYSHAIIGYLLYLKTTKQQRILAVLGSILPDLILIFGLVFHFTGDSIISKNLHNLFHFTFLHTFTELFHSFTIIIPLLAISYFFYKKAQPFFIGMLAPHL